MIRLKGSTIPSGAPVESWRQRRRETRPARALRCRGQGRARREGPPTTRQTGEQRARASRPTAASGATRLPASPGWLATSPASRHGPDPRRTDTGAGPANTRRHIPVPPRPTVAGKPCDVPPPKAAQRTSAAFRVQSSATHILTKSSWRAQPAFLRDLGTGAPGCSSFVQHGGWEPSVVRPITTIGRASRGDSRLTLYGPKAHLVSATYVSVRREIEQSHEIAVHATTAGSELDASHWPDAEARERVLAVLAYTQLMIEGSEVALISSVVASELEATLTEFVNAPEQLTSESGPWVDRLLDLTTRLPRAQGRDFEQAAKKAARTFQRSAQQRFAAVEKRAEEAQSNMEALAENLTGQRAEINALAEQFRVQQEEAAEARFAQLEARTQDLAAAAERHAQSIEALVTEQAEVFRKAQDERAEEHREREQGNQSQFELLEASTKRSADTLVSEITAMKDRSAELVGAIGITGTAERYGRSSVSSRRLQTNGEWSRSGSACSPQRLPSLPHLTTTQRRRERSLPLRSCSEASRRTRHGNPLVTAAGRNTPDDSNSTSRPSPSS